MMTEQEQQLRYCQTCNKLIVPRGSFLTNDQRYMARKYCSIRCAHAAQEAYHRSKPQIIRYCEVCKKQIEREKFMPTYQYMRKHTCSRSCMLDLSWVKKIDRKSIKLRPVDKELYDIIKAKMAREVKP